jgi:cytidylate kinase
MAEELKVTDDLAVSLVQKAIRMAHREGNKVIVGRGGQVILHGYPGVLHVRIEAPTEDRIQRVKEQFRQNRQPTADIELRRAAQDWILDRDAASADYIRRFYHEDWGDTLLYHLVINTGMLGIDQAAEVIARAAIELPEPAAETIA